MSSGGEILDGLWRFTAVHPEWDEEEDWDAEVAWWAVRTTEGLVLIDPLVEDWTALDGLVQTCGGCGAIIRTLHYHERSIPEAAKRYAAEVWARRAPPGVPAKPFDREIEATAHLPSGITASALVRDDEIALWLPEQRALAFGDAMLRSGDGRLAMCPESWMARSGGRARLREDLDPLRGFDPDHVLVSHGPLVLGDARRALAEALWESS